MSTNARRVLMTAGHLGIKPDPLLVDLAKAEQLAPKLLKLDANQRIPVLENLGLVLWESNAVMHYLAEIAPRQSVHPIDLRARADVNRCWLFWCAQNPIPGVAILNWENSIKSIHVKPERADTEKIHVMWLSQPIAQAPGTEHCRRPERERCRQWRGSGIDKHARQIDSGTRDQVQIQVRLNMLEMR